MIKVLFPGTRLEAGELVISALKRSVPPALVEYASFSCLEKNNDTELNSFIWIIIDPLEDWSLPIIKLLSSGSSKILIFGSLPASLQTALYLRKSGDVSSLSHSAKTLPASIYSFSESDARIEYVKTLGGYESPLLTRCFSRYDHTSEWNNLGYGAITTDGGIWSLSCCLKAPEDTVIANVSDGVDTVATYAALWEFSSTLLWFARSVGPSDSQEWRLIEVFLAHYGSDKLVCAPVISEIPAGYDSAVTMRLDCDEDIESARQLWHVYCEADVPMSLGLHTTILRDPKQFQLPKDILSSGGAILSHTLTHAPNWGGSYEAAYHEGVQSRKVINDATGYCVRYAVSPFHQTPSYARIALADAGYEGCVGGIICNDPDFLMARAGVPVGQGRGFIGFSQQCMMHGDCLLDGDDELLIFKQAFMSAMKGKSFFGYLDHPFSERYQYGWLSEDQRNGAHIRLINYIRLVGKKVLFSNMEDAFDFLQAKNSIDIHPSTKGLVLLKTIPTPYDWDIKCEYKGEEYIISERGVNI